MNRKYYQIYKLDAEKHRDAGEVALEVVSKKFKDVKIITAQWYNGTSGLQLKTEFEHGEEK